MSELERQQAARQGFTRALRRHLPGLHYEGCSCKACCAIEREADAEYPLTIPSEAEDHRRHMEAALKAYCGNGARTNPIPSGGDRHEVERSDNGSGGPPAGRRIEAVARDIASGNPAGIAQSVERMPTGATRRQSASQA